MSKRHSLLNALKHGFHHDSQQKHDEITNTDRRRSLIDALPPSFQLQPSIAQPSYDEFSADAVIRRAKEFQLATADPTYEPDYHIMSESVYSLNEQNFDRYIAGKEKALIMFYKNFQCPLKDFETDFASTAEDSRNTKHGFGAVDCVFNRDLCEREKVCCTPVLKLYSNGFEVGSYINAKNMTAAQMNMMVKMAPVLKKAKRVTQKPADQFFGAKKRHSALW